MFLELDVTVIEYKWIWLDMKSFLSLIYLHKSTYIFQEYVYCFVLLWINCSFEEGKENILQHLGVVWY